MITRKVGMLVGIPESNVYRAIGAYRLFREQTSVVVEAHIDFLTILVSTLRTAFGLGERSDIEFVGQSYAFKRDIVFEERSSTLNVEFLVGNKAARCVIVQ